MSLRSSGATGFSGKKAFLWLPRACLPGALRGREEGTPLRTHGLPSWPLLHVNYQEGPLVPFCVSLTVSGPGAETALGTAGTALPSGWRFGSLVTLRPHTWEWVTGWNDTPSGLRVQCQAHPCARGPASKFSAVPLRGAPNEEPGLPTPCAHPLGLQGGVLGGTAAWSRGSCPQPPTCTPAQAPAPPLARHPPPSHRPPIRTPPSYLSSRKQGCCRACCALTLSSGS